MGSSQYGSRRDQSNRRLGFDAHLVFIVPAAHKSQSPPAKTFISKTSVTNVSIRQDQVWQEKTLPVRSAPHLSRLRDSQLIGDFTLIGVRVEFDNDKERCPNSFVGHAGEIVTVTYPLFKEDWDPEAAPPSLWFNGTIYGRRRSIWTLSVLPVFNHDNPEHAHSKFLGKGQPDGIKTVSAARKRVNAGSSLPLGVAALPIDCSDRTS